MKGYAAILALMISQAIPLREAEALSGPFILYFEHGSAELDTVALHLLVRAEQLRSQSGMAINLSAHTDSSGGPEHNRALSFRRAEVVKAALIQLGAPASHVRAEGYGEARPLKETPDGTREPLNRRVELTFRIARSPIR